MSKKCTSCSKPEADVVIRMAGLSLPFHAACAREAQADLCALLAGLDIGSALMERLRGRALCGPPQREDEIR